MHTKAANSASLKHWRYGHGGGARDHVNWKIVQIRKVGT